MKSVSRRDLLGASVLAAVGGTIQSPPAYAKALQSPGSSSADELCFMPAAELALAIRQKKRVVASSQG